MEVALEGRGKARPGVGVRGLEPAENAEPARWLLERLTTFGENVLSVAPSGFEAYVRVFYPASRVTHTSATPLRWAEVAALGGRTAHRAMQWPSLRGDNPVLDDESVLEPGAVWVRGPEVGTLPLTVVQTLWPVLGRYTNTNKCFFAVWEGFGFLPRMALDAPAFDLPERRFHLFTGVLEAIEGTFHADNADEAVSAGTFVAYGLAEESLEDVQAGIADGAASSGPPYQSANLWWPEDRVWCVATEIDLVFTYLAGSQKLIDAVLASGLEAFQVRPSDGISYGADTLNPAPNDRRDGFDFTLM